MLERSFQWLAIVNQFGTDLVMYLNSRLTIRWLGMRGEVQTILDEDQAAYIVEIDLTDDVQSKYNVITMKAAIITIGNSKGIRIPKPLLEESGLVDDVDIKLLKDGLKITPIKKRKSKVSETLLMSQQSLAKEWDTAEEDEAWAFLQ